MKRIILLISSALFVNMLLTGSPMFTPTLFGSTSIYMSEEKQDYLQTDFYSTSAYINEIGNPFLDENNDMSNLLEKEENNMKQAAARRARPTHWDDPTPVGDVPYMWLLLLSAVYYAWKFYRRRKIK